MSGTVVVMALAGVRPPGRLRLLFQFLSGRAMVAAETEESLNADL